MKLSLKWISSIDGRKNAKNRVRSYKPLFSHTNCVFTRLRYCLQCYNNFSILALNMCLGYRFSKHNQRFFKATSMLLLECLGTRQMSFGVFETTNQTHI